jgi:hypothetical protein
MHGGRGRERSGHRLGDAVAGLGGVKMVDYKRATDVAAGLVPRQGYQDGGSPEDPRTRFVNQMMPHAMRVSEETGLDPRLIIAQSALETGWGRSAPGQNYFGIKSHGRAGGCRVSDSACSIRDAVPADADAIAELDRVWMSHEARVTRDAPAIIVPELEILDR